MVHEKSKTLAVNSATTEGDKNNLVTSEFTPGVRCVDEPGEQESVALTTLNKKHFHIQKERTWEEQRQQGKILFPRFNRRDIINSFFIIRKININITEMLIIAF